MRKFLLLSVALFTAAANPLFAATTTEATKTGSAATPKIDVVTPAGTAAKGTVTKSAIGLTPKLEATKTGTGKTEAIKIESTATVLDVKPAKHGEVTSMPSEQTLKTTKGTKFDVRLEGNPTSGYQWQLKAVQGDSVKISDKPDYAQFSNKKRLVGVGGVFTFHGEAVKAGKATAEFIYVRPWEKGVEPIKTVKLTIEVQ